MEANFCFQFISFIARRKNKGNFAHYAKTCEEFLQKSDAISIKWEKETLRRLGMSEDLLQQSILHYQYQNDPKLRALSTKLSEDQAYYQSFYQELMRIFIEM